MHCLHDESAFQHLRGKGFSLCQKLRSSCRFASAGSWRWRGIGRCGGRAATITAGGTATLTGRATVATRRAATFTAPRGAFIAASRTPRAGSTIAGTATARTAIYHLVCVRIHRCRTIDDLIVAFEDEDVRGVHALVNDILARLGRDDVVLQQ